MLSLLFALMQLGSLAQAGFVEPLTAWDHSPLTVCIPSESTVLTDAEAATLRDLLLSEYSIETTGIYFSKVERCDSRSENRYDLVFRFTQDEFISNAVYIGQFGLPYLAEKRGKTLEYVIGGTPAQPKAMAIFVDRVRDDNASTVFIKALHEMNHALGMRHEQLSDESLNQPYNAFRPPGFKSGTRNPEDPIMASTLQTSRFDPTSVMNSVFVYYTEMRSDWTPLTDSEQSFYSLIRDSRRVALKRDGDHTYYRVRPTLSRSDRHALKCLYLDDYKKVGRCRADFDPAN